MSVKLRKFRAAFILAALFLNNHAYSAGADNHAPFFTDGQPLGSLPERDRAAGPFYEDVKDPGRNVTALRPLFVAGEDGKSTSSWVASMYPLFSRRDYVGGHRWNVMELLVGSRAESADGEPIRSLELWPLFWHYDTGVAEESYDAVFPIAGTLRNRLFHKRIDWFLFPAFLRLEQEDRVDRSVIWPFIRWREGEGQRGWALWPLYGHFEGEGKYDNTFALWPLVYNNHRYLPETKGGGDYHTFGVLPFYARETAPGMKSESYVWPFFGYTKEVAPRKSYSEIRYLYPLWVKGQGEVKTVNRWLPFYAHETKPGYEKSWYAWPLLKHEERSEAGLDISKDTLLYFIYKDEVQQAAEQGFKARKTQLWPLFGYADNGAGERQFMLLNPFEPLISGNEMLRNTWTPFFALYRYEASADAARYSVLWDLFLYERDEGGKSFSIGPIFEISSKPESEDWSILKGLVGHGPEGWTALWGAF